MKKLQRKLLACILTLSMLAVLLPMKAFAASAPPSTIQSCTDSFGWDFYIIFPSSSTEWLNAISGVSVSGESYTRVSSSYSVWGNKTYHVDSSKNRLIVGEGATFVDYKATCVIQAEGYSDLTLELDKKSHSATVIPTAESGDSAVSDQELHVRLVGNFEAAIVGQTGYDAISSASTNVTQNKNSNASVEAALLPKDQTPIESDWKPLCDTDIRIVSAKSNVNLDSSCGMTGVYSVYDSSVTLTGTPVKAGLYSIRVTITDDQGRTAESNALNFRIYSGEETLHEQLTYEHATPTSDGKYMYDMNPWAIRTFGGTGETVTVPKDFKAWYGSHTSGTYGKLGYAVPYGSETTQTLLIPDGCDLTLVNMDLLSSVRVVVEKGGTLRLQDSVIQGIVEVKHGGTFSMNHSGFDGTGTFLTGASINGQLILQDGATLTNSKIYSNTNFIANGSEVRKNTAPVVIVNGSVNLTGQVFIKGDEAPTGTDPATGISYTGQTGMQINGTLHIADDSVLAVYGGGIKSTTTNGGNALLLNNGTVSGSGKLIAVGGNGSFGNGGNAVQGSGTISVKNAYLEGGKSYFPKSGSSAGAAYTDGITLSGLTNRNLIDGQIIKSNQADPGNATYWSDITTIPNLSLYTVDENAPGEAIPPTPDNSVSPDKEEISNGSKDDGTAPPSTPGSTSGSITGSTQTATSATSAVKTGDTASLSVWLLICALALAATGILVLHRRKENK